MQGQEFFYSSSKRQIENATEPLLKRRRLGVVTFIPGATGFARPIRKSAILSAKKNSVMSLALMT